MEAEKERRRSSRQSFVSPNMGLLLYPELIRSTPAKLHWAPLFVDILDKGTGGLRIASEDYLPPGTSVFLDHYLPAEKTRKTFQGQVAWARTAGEGSRSFYIGLELAPFSAERSSGDAEEVLQEFPVLHQTFLFLAGTKLLGSLPRKAFCRVLNALSHKQVNKGERFIAQGEPGDAIFVIQKGSCAVILEKGTERSLIARLKAGDVVGEMAVLTGENRTAHVEAETDMDLWGLPKAHFDSLAEEYLDFRDYLTELVAQRFAMSRITADRTIGKYLVTEIIGKGGYSIVYKGRHLNLEMPVAIKMMKHDMAMDHDFIQNFRQEARTVASLNHPNIIQVYDFEERYRTFFIIMELLEGTPLDVHLKKLGRLPVHQVMGYLFQIVGGLHYAHEKSLVHLDIKPANIFLLHNDRIKILDFGLSCPPGTEGLCGLGTPFYVAPEQIESDRIDGRADLYSLGIMTFELLTGVRPFQEEDISALMELHLTAELPDPRQWVPDLPEGLCQFIRKATRKNPDDRFRDMGETLVFLDRLAKDLGLSEVPVTPEERQMISLFLLYREEQRLGLNVLLEEFSKKLKDEGIHLKTAELKDFE